MELLVLGLVATIGFASYALWSKSRHADDERPAPPTPLLEAVERTPSTLQVGDVVQHLGTDYLVEGSLTLSDDGRAARLFRLVDGGAERFLYATAGDGNPFLLDAAPGITIEGSPETLLHAGQSFRLKSRVVASVMRAGAVGSSRAGDRVGLYEYTAGAAQLVVLGWSDQADAFVGERVSSHLLELLPGK